LRELNAEIMKECEKEEERKNRKVKVVVSSYCCSLGT
jgi:hypothetical protein